MNKKRRDILAGRKPKRPIGRAKEPEPHWDVIWGTSPLRRFYNGMKYLKELEEAMFSALGVPASVFRGER